MKVLVGILAAASFLIAPAAYADVFVGASAGQSKVDVAGFGADDTSLKFFAGWRKFRFFSIEGSYVDFGSPDDVVGMASFEIDLTGWDLFAVGTIPLGPSWEVFGKAGFLLWNADFSGTLGIREDDGLDAVFGMGVSVQIGPKLRVRGEYESFDIDGTDDVTMLSGGVEFRF